MAIDIDELENRIKYHRPNDYAVQAISAIRKSVLETAKDIRAIVPEGREQALAFTKLEEAMMWAIAGIARDPVNWVEPGDG